MTNLIARSAPSFLSASRSHAGLRRASNEDRLLVRPECGLWAVADGMGGHHDGGEAADKLLDALDAPLACATGYQRLKELTGRIEHANAVMFGQTQGRTVSGATLVALLIHETHYACVWAGDSRAYVLRDERLGLISRDHSVVQELVDKGVLNDAERKTHPLGHVVTRAVGVQPELVLEQRFASLQPNDVLLLCSDGLTGCLSDAEIAGAVDRDALETSADRLLQAALRAGAPDNVSLILVAERRERV